MKTFKIKTYGKINLGLDVLGKREDGYHDIKTVFQQIDLYDILYIKELQEDVIRIRSNSKNIPLDSGNLVYGGIKKLKSDYNITTGIDIYIEKNIPISAGLAGGSTNLAGAIISLNKLWSLNISKKNLVEIGSEFGADVPFCILGGTAVGEGIGEKLNILKSFKGVYILLINPNIEISAKEAYEGLNLDSVARGDIDSVIDDIVDNDLNGLSKHMKNVLESPIISKYSIIGDIKRSLEKYGSIKALMSGSGSTVFGIFSTEKDLRYCSLKMKELYSDFRIIETKTI